MMTTRSRFFLCESHLSFRSSFPVTHEWQTDSGLLIGEWTGCVASFGIAGAGCRPNPDHGLRTVNPSKQASWCDIRKWRTVPSPPGTCALPDLYFNSPLIPQRFPIAPSANNVHHINHHFPVGAMASCQVREWPGKVRGRHFLQVFQASCTVTGASLADYQHLGVCWEIGSRLRNDANEE